MTYAIVDCRISRDIERALAVYADKIIKLPPFAAFSEPVASHPDMLLWYVGKAMVTYKQYALQNRKIFDELAAAGFEITYSEEFTDKSYPNDVHLNCAVVGNKILAHRKYISKQIQAIADTKAMETVHVNQGYAKCSTAVVNENALITQDRSIEKAALSSGLDVLLVCEGNVRLDGYNTGFIGGASGTTDGEVLFCGSLQLHPDGEKIYEFCQKHGKTAISLSSEPLYDYGTIFFI